MTFHEPRRGGPPGFLTPGFNTQARGNGFSGIVPQKPHDLDDLLTSQTTVTQDIGNFFHVLFAFFAGLFNGDMSRFETLSSVYFPAGKDDGSVTYRNVGRMRSMRDELLENPGRKFTAEELAKLTEGLDNQQLRARPRKMILDMISGAESSGNYNVAQGNRSVHFTNMTVREVMQWQKLHKGESESTAVGRYQNIGPTLAGLVTKYNIPLDAKFDEAMQDRLGNHLLDEAGFREYMGGEKSMGQFAYSLSRTWAGLPQNSTGVSFYQGVGSNRATTGFKNVATTLERARQVGDEITRRNGQRVASTDQSLEGLRITKRYDENLPYGVDATREKENFSGIIVHTAGKASLGEQLAYMASPDPNRNNAQYGYHYVIDRNGDVYQTAPLEKRTNHILADKDPSFSNRNSIGVALITNGGEPTEAQKQSALKLTSGLQGQYGIDTDRVMSHADIQNDRAHVDGDHPEAHEVIAYIRENSADTATTTLATSAGNKGPKGPG